LFELEYYLACFAVASSDAGAVVNAVATDVVPTSVVVIRDIQGKDESRKPWKVLFDTGGSCSLINRRALPPGAVPARLENRQTAQTASGTFDCSHVVRARDLVFPEFGQSIQVELQPFTVFDQPDCKYDVIIGRDFLIPNQFLDIAYSRKTMEWFGRSVPMKDERNQAVYYIDEEFDDAIDDDEDHLDMLATEILPSTKYEEVSVDAVAKEQQHLSEGQRAALKTALQGHERLFSGKLGKYTGAQIHLQTEPNAAPVHCKPYPVPHAHAQVFKEELKRLCRDEDCH